MLVDLAVDAVGDGDIDEPVLAGERHGGFGTVLRERQQPRAAAAAEDDCDDVFHRMPLILLQRNSPAVLVLRSLSRFACRRAALSRAHPPWRQTPGASHRSQLEH